MGRSRNEVNQRAHKPLPLGIRGGAVADVEAKREERSAPRRPESTKALSVKVANGRSKVVGMVHNSYQLPQRIVLLVGAIATALNTLFAPWVFVLNIKNEFHEERFAGYHLITNSNEPQDATALGEIFHTHTNMLAYTSIRLDTQRLFAQLAGILCVTALCYFALKRGTRRDGITDGTSETFRTRSDNH